MKTTTRFGIEVEDVTDTKENINNIYSQAHQDLFALGLNNYKLNGTYVDIGCSMPRDCNNTYLLEKFDWKGINIDIRAFEKMWEEHRTNKFLACDATKLNYKELFDKTFNSNIIDFLSFDIDSASNIVLPLLPFEDYTFSTIAIEHDLYTGNNEFKQLQHEILNKYGYICIAENVCVFEKHCHAMFEDWWVSPEMFENIKVVIGDKNLNNTYSDEILNKLGLFLNRDWIVQNKESLSVTKNIISGNIFKSLASEYIDESKPQLNLLRKPKYIFLYTDYLNIFKTKVLPQINYSFNLITHNADKPITEEYLDVLNDSKIIKWYGMNCNIKHDKLQPIPIGIANEKWPHGNKKTLLSVANTSIEKTKLVYSNFNISTNTSKRSDVFNIIKEKAFIDIDTETHSYQEYLIKLKSYKYTISPPGNSVDCHRIWESVYLGVIPIVEKHIALETWYDLPILFVNSFNELNEQMLNEQYETIITKSKEKAYTEFYTKLMQ
jgi:hypothetical protein